MIKHLSVLTLGLIFSSGVISVMAQKYEQKEQWQLNEKKLPQGSVNFNGSEIRFFNKEISSVRKPAKEPSHTPVIMEAPGEEKFYSKECGGTIHKWTAVEMYETTYPSYMSWDGNDVYIKNVIFNRPFYDDTYVKGTYEGNVITVDVPQTVEWYERDQYGYNLVVLKLEYIGEGNELSYTYVTDEDITSFNYLVGDDGSLTLDLPGGFDGENLPEHIIGLIYTDVDPTYDGQWTGESDFYQVYHPFNEKPNAIPEGIEPETYSLVMGDYGYPIEVAFDNESNKVYFKGMSQQYPEGVVYGYFEESDGNDGVVTVKIPQNQYMGVLNDEVFLLTKVVVENPYFDPNDPDSVYWYLAPDDVDFEIIYNKEENTFHTMLSGVWLSINVAKDRVYYLDIFDNFLILQQDSYAGVPADPYDLDYNGEGWMDYGFNLFYFVIPCITADNHILDSNGISYSIYVDGDIMEFEKTNGVDLLGIESVMYMGINKPTEQIPITFENYWDIIKYSETLIRVGLYVEGLTTVGVQTFYTYDGVTTNSDIITLDVETGEIVDSGIAEISSADVVSTEYYNVNGIRINYPEKGIFFKRTLMSDGSYVVTKTMVR